MSKVAIFSDLHLGIYGNSEDWHKIALDWADWIVKDLNKRGIKECWFLGDFFHNRSEISVQTVHVATEILNKFKDIDLIVLVGNHDAYYKNRADVHSLGLLKGHNNIKVVDDNYEITRDGKKCLFVPWEGKVEDKKYDYIFGHFEIQSFMMNNFKKCDKGWTPSELLSKSPSVYSGHFHKRSSQHYKEGHISYIGNTFQMDFADEENQKGYHIIDFTKGEVEFVSNKVSPNFKKIFVSKLKSCKEEDIQNNHVKIVFDREMDEEKIEKVKRYIQRWKPFQIFTEYSFSSKNLDDVEQIDSFELSDMFEEFIDELKPEREENVEKIIKELYEKHR